MDQIVSAVQQDLSVLRPPERDLRLDLFRGVGQWMVFLDHIPHDVVSWLTLRNYGFSDAAEFFVFISGYLAGFIYGPAVRGGYFLAATKRLMKRVWQLYIAHIFLFLLFTAQVARTAKRFDNPMYEDEFNVFNFLQHPDVMIGQALTLKYKPVNFDVLPLYMALLFATPLILWCLVRRPALALFGSVVLYVAARWFDWNLPSYPAGSSWYFNPFAWQMMFVFAAWCGLGGSAQLQFLIRSRAALVVAVAWLAFAFLIVMTWHSAFLESLVPKWLIKVIYPIDKSDLDMLRFTHFLALALVVVRFVPKNWPPLTSKWLWPLMACGRHSLPIFCLGIFLSFSAHWLLTQYSKGFAEQLFVSVVGIAIMVAAARLLDWYKKVPVLFEASQAEPKAEPEPEPAQA